MKTSYAFIVSASLLFLFSCSSKEDQLLGKWIGVSEKDGNVEFIGNGELIWNEASKRNFEFISESTIEVATALAKESYAVAIKNDTLTLTGTNRKYTYIDEDKAKSSPDVLKILTGRKISNELKMPCKPLDFKKITLQEIKDNTLLQPQAIEKFNPEDVFYFISYEFPDKTVVSTISQPFFLKGGLDVIWAEVYESAIRRSCNLIFGERFVKSSLKKNAAGIFEGTVTTADGKSVEITQGKSIAIVDNPQNIQTAATLMLTKSLGAGMLISLENKSKSPSGEYAMTASLATGDKIELTFDANKGWKPIQDIENVKKIALIRMKNMLGTEVDFISFKTSSTKDIFDFALQTKANGDKIKGTFHGVQLSWCPSNTIQDLQQAIKWQAQTQLKTKVTQVSLTTENKRDYVGKVVAETGSIDIIAKHEGTRYRWGKKPKEKQTQKQIKTVVK